MKRLILFLMFIVSVTIVSAEEITVLAAASLKYVLEDIKTEFLKNRKEDVININYIASGKAYHQIVNGYPAHLFIAADTDYPNKLFDTKITPNKPVNYAKGKLVLFSADDTLKIESIDVLNRTEIKNIAIANPRLAPYGAAAKQALENVQLYDKLKDKLVLGESIGQTTQYIKSKSSEIGFTALSMVIKDKTANYIIIDQNLYNPILQAMVITKQGTDSKLANDFSKFILESTQIFSEYGYDKP